MIKTDLRASIFAAAVFFVLCPFAAQAEGSTATAEGINWRTDLSGALQEAKAQHKLVLVDVWTTWCVDCLKLDRSTFKDPQLTKYVQSKFLCVKANAEDKGEGQKFAEDNGIKKQKSEEEKYPVALVLGPNGKVLGTIEGFKKAPDYQEALKKLVSKAK